jgi:hypothetical protein
MNKHIIKWGIFGIASSAIIHYTYGDTLYAPALTYIRYNSDKKIVNMVIGKKLSKHALKGKLMSGEDFNKIYHDSNFVVLSDYYNCCPVTGKSYTCGLNIYSRPMRESPGIFGGLYFVEESVEGATNSLLNITQSYIAYNAVVPNDAYVYVNHNNEFHASKLNIGNSESIINYIDRIMLDPKCDHYSYAYRRLNKWRNSVKNHLTRYVKQTGDNPNW